MKILSWVVVAAYLVWPNSASAFYDDLCFVPPETTGGNYQVGDCLPNISPYCFATTAGPTAGTPCVPTTDSTGNPLNCGADPGSEGNSLCYSNVTFVPLSNSTGARSMIHADSVYLLAKAVGLQDIVAYFIAAYSDTPDRAEEGFILMVPTSGGGYTQYTDPLHKTIALPGLYRDYPTGNGIHFPLVRGTPSATPDPTDTIHEGVSRLRSWALGTNQYPCLGGLTLPSGRGASLSYFSGTKCYVQSSSPTSSISFERGAYLVNSIANVGGYPSGDQPFASTTPTTSPCKMSEAISSGCSYVFAGDLVAALTASTGRLCGNVVPLAPLQMGVYLHSLMDRVSHTPMLGSLTMSGSAKDLAFSPNDVTPSYGHPYLHFEEVGIPRPLSSRTEKALNLAYDELAKFAALNRGLAGGTVKAKSSVVPPLVHTVLTQRSAADRLAKLETLSTSLGYSTLLTSSSSCPIVTTKPPPANCGQTASGFNTCQ